MPKRILMVDADAPLREQVASSLTARGYEFEENPDGREALEQIRTFQPELLILNVELPRGSGYALCSKLRKDEALKGTKVILTSAEATQKAFDDHKKLKLGRADDYLLKPFEAVDLIRRTIGLLGDEYEPEPESLLELEDGQTLAEPGPETEDRDGEERISLDDIEEIAVEEELGPSDAALPGERDVDLLESAFQRLEESPPSEAQPAPTLDRGSSQEGLDLLDETFADPQPSPLDEQANEILQALESEPAERTLVAAYPPPIPRATRRGQRPASAPESAGGPDREHDSENAGRLAQQERELRQLRGDLSARETELAEQRDREALLEGEIARKREELTRRDGQIRQLQQRIDALIAGQRRGEKDLQASREEARAALQRAETAERARSQSEGLQREQDGSAARLATDLDDAHARLADLQAEAEQLRTRNQELDAETRELRGHRAEIEEEKLRNEERLIKSYQRLQDGERVRAKTKQALGLALQLLDESGAEEEPEDETRP